MSRVVVALLALTWYAVAQSANPSAVALQHAGHVNGQVYSNDALGFSIEFPAGWQIESGAAPGGAAGRGVYGDDPEARQALEQQDRVAVRLANATPKTGTRPDPRGIQMVVVPKARLPKDAQKGFSPAAALALLVDVPMGQARKVKIAGMDFVTVGKQVGSLPVDDTPVPIRLAMYAIMRGDNVIVFGITAGNEKESAEVAKTLETLHFKALATPSP